MTSQHEFQSKRTVNTDFRKISNFKNIWKIYKIFSNADVIRHTISIKWVFTVMFDRKFVVILGGGNQESYKDFFWVLNRNM